MHTDEPRKNPLTDLGYETEDMNMRGLWTGAKWFFIFTFFAIFAGAGLYMLMNRQGIANSQEVNTPFLSKVPAAPNPLLQTNVTTKTDMLELRRNELNEMTTPAVVDKAKDVIRIPVDHAMDLATQRFQAGTPVLPDSMATPPAGAAPAPATTPAPGEPQPDMQPIQPGVRGAATATPPSAQTTSAPTNKPQAVTHP